MTYMTVVLDDGRAGRVYETQMHKALGEPTHRCLDDGAIKCVWQSPSVDEVHEMVDEIESNKAIISVSYDSGDYEVTTNT